MKITTRKTCIRTIKSDNPKFYIQDGLITAPRAGFEIDERCPKEYKAVIMQAMQYGWIKPVANLKDSELFWEAFSE